MRPATDVRIEEFKSYWTSIGMEIMSDATGDPDKRDGSFVISGTLKNVSSTSVRAKNIHVERDGRAVLIDWETATPYGLPLLDLFYFITRQAYLACPPWRKKIDQVRRFYSEPSDANEVARLAAQHYCTALDLPISLIAPMQRLHFLYRARIKA
jgi:hypothetical protein